MAQPPRFRPFTPYKGATNLSQNETGAGAPRKPLRLTDEESAELQADHENELAEKAEFEERDESLRKLMSEVERCLTQIASDIDVRSDKTREAVTWALRNPLSLVSFLESGNWLVKPGRARVYRGSFLRQLPTYPRTAAKKNRALFHGALKKLLEVALTAPSSYVSEPERSAAFDALSGAYFARLEREYRGPPANPAFVWVAYSFARRSGASMPGWVTRYLDESADAVESYVEDPIGYRSVDLVRVFGFETPKIDIAVAVRKASSQRERERIFAYLHPRQSSGNRWSGRVLAGAMMLLSRSEQRLRDVHKEVLAQLEDTLPGGTD